MQTKIFKMSEACIDYKGITECAHIIKKGGIVAFPTETVYGLGVARENRRALKRLHEVKGRPKQKPFTVHIGPYQRIEDFTSDKSIGIYKLIDKFWPGPLTLILKGKEGKVGLRCPANKIAQELINRSIKIIAATSANISGRQSIVDSEELLDTFGGKVEAIINAGKTSLAIESSIVDLSEGSLNFLRVAAIEKEEIEKVWNRKVILFICTGNSCRSVMAKALLEKKLKERAREETLEVIDAGVGTFGGAPPSDLTLELLAREDIDASGHISVQLTRKMIRRADLILTMAKIHESQVLSLVPEAKKRLYLLKEFALGVDSFDADIPDPIGRPIGVYEDCFRTIKQAIERLGQLI